VATAVGVPLGNLASRAMGCRTALVLVALVCLVVAIGLARLLPRRDGGPKVSLRARPAAPRDPAVRVLLPVTMLGMAAACTAYAVPAFDAVGVPAADSSGTSSFPCSRSPGG
jgi:DHA1 family inner membrane transport protein